MKNCFLLPLLFYSQMLAAQFKQDVALHRTNVSSSSVTAEPVTPRSVAASARNMIGNLKGRIKKMATQKSATPPAAATIVLHAERLDSENIMVYWQVPAAGNATSYIIERRFGDPHGPFDSVGTVRGYPTDPAEQSYRLVDKNDFKGSTFYRLREKSGAKKESGQTSVMVSGNNRGLQVSSGPAVAGTLTITLSKFKIAPRTHLYITDAQGSLVYQKKNVFFTTGHTIELTGIQLPRGTYHLEVVNHYNTGVNTLVIH